jgi:hypothetical protein
MKAPRGIRAYHGSPYNFDRFDASKIGTGEGAQAYGHGLYFTENEGIARNYRDTLSAGAKGRASLEYDGDRIKDLRREDATEGQELRDQILDKIAGEMSFFDQKPQNVISRKIKMLEADVAEPIVKTGDPEIDEISELTRLSELRQLEVYKSLDPEKFKSGKMYEVNIAADPSNMIDYDVNIGNQSPEIKAKIKTLLDNELTPDDAVNFGYDDMDLSKLKSSLLSENRSVVSFLNDLAAVRGRDQAGEELLQKYGIPGIKYFSDTSRNTSGGELIDVIKDADGFKAKVAVDNRAGGLGGSGRVVTTSAPYKTEKEARDWAEQATKNQERNYVVFDDSMIEIMRKYGLLAPLVGAGTVAAVSDMGEDRGLLEM